MNAIPANGTQRVLGACPLDCPDTCSWVVTVQDGRAVKLEGDAAHPFTRGVLCNKVNGYVAYSQSPDRLLHPMRRVGPKGRGDFVRISWDEALDEIAERLAGTIREFGPEAIWPYLGSGSMGLLQGCYAAGRRLWNALGASHHLVTICTIAGGVGTGYTLGDNRVGMDPETLRFSKLIILWGSNTLSTNHHLWRSITTARQQGASLVVIDPIRTRTADAADLHLAPIPGTDAALALGLLNVVLAEGAEDQAFIDQHTHGWDAFRARILEYPPDRVADICGHSEAGHRRFGEADRPNPAHRDPGDHGAPAARRRRDGRADHHVHPRCHRGLALSGRRGRVRHARVLRAQLAGPVSGRPEATRHPHAEHDAPRGGPARGREPARQGAVHLRQQPPRQRAAPVEDPAGAGATRSLHGGRRSTSARTPSSTRTSCCPRPCSSSTPISRSPTDTSTSPGTSRPSPRRGSASRRPRCSDAWRSAWGSTSPASTTATTRWPASSSTPGTRRSAASRSSD